MNSLNEGTLDILLLFL